MNVGSPQGDVKDDNPNKPQIKPEIKERNPDLSAGVPAIKLSTLQNLKPVIETKDSNFSHQIHTCEFEGEIWYLKKCLRPDSKDTDQGLRKATQEAIGGLFARFLDPNHPEIRIARDEKSGEYYTLSKKNQRISDFLREIPK